MIDLVVRFRAVWVLLALASSSAYAAPPVVHSLCGPQQTTYFSCQTNRHRIISMCGGLPSALQYRYGAADRLELAFPDRAAQGAQLFAFAHYSRYQTERTEVSFSHGHADYTVFEYTEHGHRTAGVEASTADGKSAEILCVGRIQGGLLRLRESLPCDKDSALNGADCP